MKLNADWSFDYFLEVRSKELTRGRGLNCPAMETNTEPAAVASSSSAKSSASLGAPVQTHVDEGYVFPSAQEQTYRPPSAEEIAEAKRLRDKGGDAPIKPEYVSCYQPPAHDYK